MEAKGWMGVALVTGGCVHPSGNVGLPVAVGTPAASYSATTEGSDTTYYSRKHVDPAVTLETPPEHVDTGRQVGGDTVLRGDVNIGSVPIPTQSSLGLRYGLVPGLDAGFEASLGHIGASTRVDVLHGASMYHLVLTGDARITAHGNWALTSRALFYVPLLKLNSDDRLSIAALLGPDVSTGRFRYDTLHSEGFFGLSIDPVERRELRAGGIFGLSLLDSVGHETVFFALLYTTPKYENIGGAAEYNHFGRKDALMFGVSVTLSAYRAGTRG